MARRVSLAALLALIVPLLAHGQAPSFSRMDVFDLEWVASPQVSPDGNRIVYQRRGMDVMEDRRTSALWLVSADGTGHTKLTNRTADESSPRWSPDGSKIAFTSSGDDHGTEIYVHWVEENKTARLTQLENAPSGLSWSPDGTHLAFSAHVSAPEPTLASPPEAPEGADWAEPPRVETRLNHEANGVGVLDYGYDHLFVVRADGGRARQVTSGDYHHSSRPVWTPDGEALIYSANRHDNWKRERRNSELYTVPVEGGESTPLTDRFGPDHTPRVSPDGEQIAFLGYDDEVQTYQVTRLYVMDRDGSNQRAVDLGLNRSIDDLAWDEDGEGLYFQYEDEGTTTLGHTTFDGSPSVVAENLGGTSIGRPYGGGHFSVSNGGRLAFNQTSPAHPAELAVTRRGQDTTRQLTDLNGDLLDDRTLGSVEEIRYSSSKDGREIHGWVVTPPNYDPDRAYPLMVEIHGGPISNYGDRFSTEIQLYAADGYVVFYPNARGSTSYGEEFGNLLYNDFSGGEYQDIMDGVDRLVKRDYVADDSLYVTGGSAGGTSAAWITGKTDRFRAAAAQKPVTNWISKTLAADNYYGYAEYRYPGQPWENPMEYWDVSPVSLLGSMNTPTVVIVGGDDLRTPPWQAKQLYNGLKLRGVEAAYVEIPGASHGIAYRPSQLITKADHVLGWFDRYRQ
ncbi:S9 family peptidase [Salinibacter altiplanensis]|uniref:S9 family peptidase n=1 Tax=Salinibacter altiplanensis TaxID=1803181 RepID=UPI000C9F4AFB|nr:S9 family peptidase [Salinibacter altiplanensis]